MATDDPYSVGGAAGTIATAPLTVTPRILSAGSYNPAVYNAKQALDDYKSSVARRLGGAGGAGGLTDALVNDPQYQKLLQAHNDAQQSHVLGMTAPDFARTRAASDYLANAAQAVNTDAGSRQLQAQGGYARDVGQGAAYQGQAAESNAKAGETTGLLPFKQAESRANTNRTTELTPVEKAVGYANANAANAGAEHSRAMTPAEVAQTNALANATNAGAARTNALIPPEVAQGNAAAARAQALIAPEVAQGNAAAGKTTAETGAIQQETKLRPQIVQAAQAIAMQDRALDQQKTQSEISKNLRNPVTGQVDGAPTPPTAAPAGAPAPPAAASPTPPAAAGPAPAGPSLLSKAMPAMVGMLGAPAVGAAGSGAGYVANSFPGASDTPSLLGKAMPAMVGMLGAPVVGAAGSAARYVSDSFPGGQAAAPAAPAAAAPSAPAVAPDRRQLPDGRMVEVVGNLVYQIMPDGTRRLLKVAP